MGKEDPSRQVRPYFSSHVKRTRSAGKLNEEPTGPSLVCQSWNQNTGSGFLFITTMLTSLTWSLWRRVLSSAEEIAAPWSSVPFPLDRDSGRNFTSFLCIRFYTIWRWWCPELETMGFGVNRPNWRPGHHLPVSLLHLSKLEDHLSPTSGRARQAGSVMPDPVTRWVDVNGDRHFFVI